MAAPFDPTGTGRFRLRPNPGDFRVSNAERDEMSNILARAFGEGRLDEAELEQRLAAVAAAKYRRELYPLVADLPPGDAPMPAPHRRPVRGIALVALVVLAVMVASSSLWSAPWHLLVLAVVVLWLLDRRRSRRGWSSCPPAA
ncbi:MAG TPA: DUF1707 domain-containing protein [Acidimicrobiales bacterium]|nr:DUF1707 domain-containing protein [Acidimicrobiales bacterium]